ncbi:unnamed protein product, partial [marine sediment metagenome]
GASAWQVLSKGTDNHVLTMDGNYPNWEAAAAAGGTNDLVVCEYKSYDADDSWVRVCLFAFGGTGNIGTPSYIDFVIAFTAMEGPAGVRIYDLTNAAVIASDTNIADTSGAWTIITDSSLTNLSADKAVWELQIQRAILGTIETWGCRVHF